MGFVFQGGTNDGSDDQTWVWFWFYLQPIPHKAVKMAKQTNKQNSIAVQMIQKIKYAQDLLWQQTKNKWAELPLNTHSPYPGKPNSKSEGSRHNET